MNVTTAVPSRRRTMQGRPSAHDSDTRATGNGSIHIDPPRRNSYVPGQPLPTDAAPAVVDRRREAELQRQQRAPLLVQPVQLAAGEVPRFVAPRPSARRTSGSTASSSAGAPAKLEVLANPRAADTNAAAAPSSASHHDTAAMSRAAQEELRMSEIARLNGIEEAKAQPRKVTNAKAIATAAADARQQLGQPTYVALATQKASAEAHYEEAHQHTQIAANLHHRLGLLPAAAETQQAEMKENKGSATRRQRLPSPAHVMEDVTDKVLALRRAEMAEMVARLRRLLAEGNVTATPDEIPIIPAVGVMGGSGGAHCPACDLCIEITSAEFIGEHLIPVLRALSSERVVMPMAGRRGSVSVTSSAASDSAATLDSFRIQSSRRIAHHHQNGMQMQQQQQQQEPSGPSRYAVPRCFRLEIVPFGLRKISVHVSVQDFLAEHFYKAHAQRQERLFSLALDPPYPVSWSEWTAADRTRLLHRVVDDLLHGGPHPPVPAVTECVTVFPAHIDATRDALWNSVWSARSLSQLLTVPEDEIASYFGPEVMFYYAWMNHYARWLLGAGVLGVVVSLLSSAQLVDPAVMSGVFVEPMSAFTAFHFTVRRYLQHGLDTILLPAFIVVMVTGGVLCIKTWERRCSVLTMKHHLFQQEGKDEPRRDFHGTPGLNPVTGEPQLRFPAWYRALVLQPVAWALVMLFMAGTIAIMVCSLNLDGMVSDASSRLAIPALRRYTINGNVLDAEVHPYLAMLPRIGYSVCISTLSYVFTLLATRLTQMENYRHRGEYVRALTMKRVAFEFVNSYAKLFFIAFGRSSMPELASNLQSILYVAVLSRMMTDTVVPFFITHRQRVARRLLQHHDKERAKKEGGEKEGAVATAAEKERMGNTAVAHGGDASSPLDEVDEMLDPYDVYEDFIEMIIQLGYILLFAAAYPLASFVALLSNVIEVRSDLFKMCYVVRRPVPRLGLQENATWCGVMRVFVMAAVITNTFLLAFTSHQMARWFPEYFVTNTTVTAVPYGSMHGVSSLADASTSAASMASLANSKDVAGVAIDMIPGTGRVVMAYSMVMEHAMGLVAAFLLWRIPSTPRAVRHYKERILYERMSRN